MPGLPNDCSPAKESKSKYGMINIECGNVTHLYNARHVLKERKFDYFFGQEHSLPARDWAKTRKAYQPWSVHLSGLDEEVEKPLGGIFAMRRDRREHLRPQAKGTRFKSLNGKGRVQLYYI